MHPTSTATIVALTPRDEACQTMAEIAVAAPSLVLTVAMVFPNEFGNLRDLYPRRSSASRSHFSPSAWYQPWATKIGEALAHNSADQRIELDSLRSPGA